MDRLAGKVALVTGAARGQGRAHAVALAREGADVVAIDICTQIPSVPYPMAGAGDLDQTLAEVEKTGRRALGSTTDVRDQSQLNAAVAAGIEEFGRIDIVVINHGIWTRGPLWELTDDSWHDMLDVNLTGVWRTLKAVAPGMIAQHSGSVIIASSASAVRGQPGAAHYSAAKHGANGLMKAAAQELAPHGVRVNAIMPGLVDTGMTDWQGCYEVTGGHPGATRAEHEQGAHYLHADGGLIRPDEVSGIVVFLASDDSARITGAEIPVDGGNLLLPGFNPVPIRSVEVTESP
ncbi:mycofactocin-coupled SDR family oxidoreductase [Kribbella sp. NPDC056861]|uniref:mycofactocin-coupled SDR family oxidoreductase n=1 Tax=Kribbella sp. NPDC056861 TaxID=3154857 RepID=UPI003413C4AF